ncbi:MAG: CRISPR-associated endonuclease Cas2 [Sphingobacteriales bacterium]|nr:MAG: CRISPR-associated endonuclease Cas2 [Sphingobacteriales bacterium]
MNNYIISYDISNDKLRQKISKLLTQKGCSRLQKSVHLAPKFSVKELEQLKNALQPLMSMLDPVSDSVMCITAPDSDMEKAYWHGSVETWKSITEPPLFDIL